MKLILMNNTINILKVDGHRSYNNRVERNILDIYIPVTEGSFEEIMSSFTKENLQIIKLEQDENVYIHRGYTIMVSASLKPVIIQPAKFEVPEISEDYYVISVGQQDDLYTEVNELKENINQQNELLADIIGGAI